MSWREVSLGEITTMKYGKLPPKVTNPDAPYPIFTGYRIAGYCNEYLYEKPQVIVVARGVGGTGDVKLSPEKSWITNLSIVLATDSTQVDTKFLCFLLGLERLKERLNTGAAQAQITIENLAAYNVRIPPLKVQQKIAEFVSAYGDLIENNSRRIALLDEATRLLYREWFVYFRFPGHEHFKVVDGVPEGWDIKLLSYLCRPGDGIQTGPFGSQLHQSDYTEFGVPVVMPKDIRRFRIETEGVARIPEDLADRLGRHRMEVGDTVYGRRGDIGRRAFIGRRQAGWFCGTGCLRIRPDSTKIVPRYLFEALGSQQTAGFIANQAKGSTMPNLSAGALQNVPVLCPPIQLQHVFVEEIEPTIELLEVLTQQNRKLAQARDLLLPRLMNGEIEV